MSSTRPTYDDPVTQRWIDLEGLVNMRDLAPTYLELAGLKPSPQMTGKSLVNILRSEKSGFIENRYVMLAGKERHDLGQSVASAPAWCAESAADNGAADEPLAA